jgi:hypothetical protein
MLRPAGQIDSHRTTARTPLTPIAWTPVSLCQQASTTTYHSQLLQHQHESWRWAVRVPTWEAVAQALRLAG